MQCLGHERCELGDSASDRQSAHFTQNADLSASIATTVHVRYMSSSVRLSVFCLSVTFVHPIQAIEIFDNVSTPFGTLAISDLSVKILQRSFQGNPSVRGGGVKRTKPEKLTNMVIKTTKNQEW